MKLGVIGYRNHSLKVIKYLLKKKYNLTVYCYKTVFDRIKSKNITYTYDINDLNKVDAVFICSPSNTHFKYIKHFLLQKIYIFCEKPGIVNKYQINFISRLDQSYKNKIYINYNYIHSNFFNFIKNEFQKKENGKLLYIDVKSTHGLIFRKKFKNNWRNKQKNNFDNIFGNLCIHYINLFLWLFDDIKLKNNYIENYSKTNKDTSITILENKLKNKILIFLSYATVFSKEVMIYFTNSIYVYKNNNLYLLSPRDTFDNNGLMISPKAKLIKKNLDMSKSSIYSSIDYFCNKVKNRKRFDKKFLKNAIRSSKLIMDN